MTVEKDLLSQLAAEVSQLKINLPKILNKATTSAAAKVERLEEEIKDLHVQNSALKKEVEQWKSKWERTISDSQKDKQENVRLQYDVQELTTQLTQQSEYCSSLGSACCTLLWRVSRVEDSIKSILVGTKVDEFLNLITNTLTSYITAYKEDWPKEESDETQFIWALCGIITNIAATAYGRDFLISNQHGKALMETFITVLGEAPTGKSSRLKNLILMSLYNISINQKGIKFLCKQKSLLGILSWLLQEEQDIETKQTTLQLIQSMLSEEGNFSVVHELAEVLPESILKELSVDKSKEIRELTQEIITDMQQKLQHEL
ncbi:hypothetical protein FSP39_019603 [Pinctada imbricata]|uniref:Heat shock factor 2-binding protein n=1 Tax=Pinctada imbricata TaxID=66713 RepID=A0AA88YBY2_PINIB|nr:hypothetical protein FSP39_019603 [Pinctada imbricata]